MNRLKYSFILLTFSCFLFTPLLSNASTITYFGSGADQNGQNNLFSALDVDTQLYHWFTKDPVYKNPDGTYNHSKCYYNINSWYITNDSNTLPLSYGTSGMLYLEVLPDGTYENPEIFLYDKDYGFANSGLHPYYAGYYNFLESTNYIAKSVKLPENIYFTLGVFSFENNYTYLGNAFTVAAVPPVPEPSTMLLLGSGLVGLVGFGRKRMKK